MGRNYGNRRQSLSQLDSGSEVQLLCVKPELYVSQTGKTSVVNILPADHVRDALRQTENVQRDDVEVVARPRTGAPTNFGHDMYNSHVLTSNVVRLALSLAVVESFYFYE